MQVDFRNFIMTGLIGAKNLPAEKVVGEMIGGEDDEA